MKHSLYRLEQYTVSLCETIVYLRIYIKSVYIVKQNKTKQKC